jgi:hypothetical protein
MRSPPSAPPNFWSIQYDRRAIQPIKRCIGRELSSRLPCLAGAHGMRGGETSLCTRANAPMPPDRSHRCTRRSCTRTRDRR